jgi:formylmethanofuran dehydrogenase subunit E
MTTIINELAATYSDLYKEVNGFRPRNMGEWTAEQYQSEIDWLMEEAKRQMEEEEIFQQHNIKLVEERISNIIKCGAGDRATALRWIHEAEGTDGDNDYLCFELRIPYGYFNI